MTEEQKPTAAKKASKSQKGIKHPPVLTPEKWAEAERAWAQGQFSTMDELASTYGITVLQANNHMAEKGIKKSQAIAAYNKKIQEELDKKAKQEAKVLADRIAETREIHYKMATNIATAAYQEIVRAKADSQPLSTVKSNLASLESAMKILKMAREERFAVLGIDREGADLDEEEVPELVVNELTPDQITEMRERAAAFEREDADEGEIDANIVDIEDQADDAEEEDVVEIGDE